MGYLSEVPIGTVMISVADPNSWNTLAVGAAAMLIGWTSYGRAIFLVFTQRTIGMIVTALIRVDATIRQRSIASALELRTKTGVLLAFRFVRSIATI